MKQDKDILNQTHTNKRIAQLQKETEELDESNTKLEEKLERRDKNIEELKEKIQNLELTIKDTSDQDLDLAAADKVR